MRKWLLCFFLVSGVLASPPAPAGSSPNAHWRRYLRTLDTQAKAVTDPAEFWAPGLPADWRERLQRGEVVVRPIEREGFRTLHGALIHRWAGSIFIPHAHVPQVLAITRDFNHYCEVYKPAIVQSRLLT